MGQRASDAEKRTCVTPFDAECKPYERATAEITYFGKDNGTDIITMSPTDRGDEGEPDPFSIRLD